MNPERWRRVEELFRAALERPSDSRARFLAEACDDGDVRHEVESLLRRRDAPDAGTPAWPVSESLPGGARLGPYEILSQIGAGGMGTVHRARDTRLNRIVAIKICREPVSGRFEREARAIAALNHPHICTLHDLGDHDGVDYLVMEYVEGESLAERLTKGPLPTGQALRYAIEIADALTAAHARGIVHRDLKPGNIMVTKTGVKVLDFGLAKIQRGAAAAAGTDAVTHPEMIAGTPQYMSPEQIQGKDVDSRSDIFSFGLVLYEMLSGRRAFDGENAAVVTAAILEHEAPTIESEGLNRVVRACLEKDPNERLQTARDLRRAIEWNAGSGTIALAPPRRRTWIPWATAAVFAALALLVWLRESPSEGGPRRLALSVIPPSDADLPAANSHIAVPEISPDGSSLLYRASGGLWLRRLDSLEPELVRGSTEIADTPFWSADSRSAIFRTIRGLIRVRVPDGSPEVIAQAPGFSRGGTAADNGTILISYLGGLYEMPAFGGGPKPVLAAGMKAGSYRYPQFVAGGPDFLFLLTQDQEEGGEVYLATLENDKLVNPTFLMKNDTAASYTSARGGRILFVRNDNLYSLRLNHGRRRLEGDPDLVQRDLASVPGPSFVACFSVSENGTVVWRPGKVALNQATAFDRAGKVVKTAGPPTAFNSLTLSPDESRLLASGSGAWLLEPGQSGRLGLESEQHWSRWVPDGLRLIGWRRGVGFVEGDASGKAVQQFGPARTDLFDLEDVAPDGKQVLIRRGIEIVSVGLREPEQIPVITPLIHTGETIWCPGYSPDGRYLVYTERRQETYVQQLSGSSLRTQIANVGGYARWRKDGREIAVFDGKAIWSIPVTRAEGGLRYGAPALLFSGLHQPTGADGGACPLAVSQDGSRFYLPVPVEQKEPGVIHVGVGWVK